MLKEIKRVWNSEGERERKAPHIMVILAMDMIDSIDPPPGSICAVPLYSTPVVIYLYFRDIC